MIKKAPLTFVIGFLVLAVLIGWVEYKFIFQELLNWKDEQINTLKSRTRAAEPRVDASSPFIKVPGTRVSGQANTSGSDSPAITGDNNTTTYGDSKPEKPRRNN